MGFFEKLLGRPPPAPVVTRWPLGTMVVDLRNAQLASVEDGSVFVAVAGVMSQGDPPPLRAFVFPAAALVAWSKNGVVMADRLRALHLVTRPRDNGQNPTPDAAIVDGELQRVGGAAYLLWALGITPFHIGANGQLPVIEAVTALGRPVVGVRGDPIGREPPDALLRKVNLQRDDLERKSDAAAASGDALANGELVTKLLKLATDELAYVSGVLRDT